MPLICYKKAHQHTALIHRAFYNFLFLFNVDCARPLVPCAFCLLTVKTHTERRPLWISYYSVPMIYDENAPDLMPHREPDEGISPCRLVNRQGRTIHERTGKDRAHYPDKP